MSSSSNNEKPEEKKTYDKTGLLSTVDYVPIKANGWFFFDMRRYIRMIFVFRHYILRSYTDCYCCYNMKTKKDTVLKDIMHNSLTCALTSDTLLILSNNLDKIMIWHFDKNIKTTEEIKETNEDDQNIPHDLTSINESKIAFTTRYYAYIYNLQKKKLFWVELPSMYDETCKNYIGKINKDYVFIASFTGGGYLIDVNNPQVTLYLHCDYFYVDIVKNRFYAKDIPKKFKKNENIKFFTFRSNSSQELFKYQYAKTILSVYDYCNYQGIVVRASNKDDRFIFLFVRYEIRLYDTVTVELKLTIPSEIFMACFYHRFDDEDSFLIVHFRSIKIFKIDQNKLKQYYENRKKNKCIDYLFSLF